MPQDYDLPLLIGGGMGLAPLLFLAQSLNMGEFHLLAGFASKKDTFPLEQIIGPVENLSISTEDGSLGIKGLVTDLFLEHLTSFDRQQKNLVVYACGPRPMLEQVVRMCGDKGIACQVSLETYMACGVGACLGCAVKASTRTGQAYYHVCTEGPVFNGEDIEWNSRIESG